MTVWLTSCLAGLDSAATYVMLKSSKIITSLVESKQVKQDVSCTVTLPLSKQVTILRVEPNDKAQNRL